MYTFFKTEERYAVERRKLPAFCRVKKAAAEQKRPSRNKKAAAGIKRLPPEQKGCRRNKKAAAGKFSRGGLYCDIEFLSVPYLTIA